MHFAILPYLMHENHENVPVNLGINPAVERPKTMYRISIHSIKKLNGFRNPYRSHKREDEN